MLLLTDRATLTSPLPLVTVDEARMLGIALHKSTYIRLRRGIYAERADYLELQPWKRYAVRVHAFTRRHPEAVLCLESAAVIHGLPLFGETRDIHVYAPDLTTSQRFGDVCVHTSVDDRELTQVGGIPATSLLDTVIDLARVLTPARGLAVVDSAISPAQGGTLRIPVLRDRSNVQRNARGRARQRWVWDHADGLAESPGESVSRAVISWCGFETPELQHRFRYEGHDDRVDFLFPSNGAIGESDGWGKYQLGNTAKAADLLAEEMRREDRLRRHRHPFARWDLADAWRVAPLRAALTAAGVPRRHPEQPAMLATLKKRDRERVPKRVTGR
ncbi:MAG: hypothetical protein WBA87_08980 [Microbacterium sp.]